MEPDFWRRRWAKNEIGFHKDAPNPMLTGNLAALGLEPGARVFVPLCGKTRDIGWLLGQGHRVAGNELSEIAITQLFADLGVEPGITPLDALRRFSAPGLDILVGDIFDLSAETLGPVDATYDRGALIALPPDMRARYASHVHRITRAAPQLAITLEYEPGLIEGPPFSMDAADLARVHGADYALTRLATLANKDGLKGGNPSIETAWLLRPRDPGLASETKN